MKPSPKFVRAMRGFVTAAAFLAVAYVQPSLFAPKAQAEVAVAPEKNPPGDIPDSQVFVGYTSPVGFTIKIPEGWARSEKSASVSFVSKLDGVFISVSSVTVAPKIGWVTANYLPRLIKSGHAVKIRKVSSVKLPGGTAIRIIYSSNSLPNPVTNRKIRLENNRYLFFRRGTLAALDLYAPYGADNVDQWRLMSRSFRWQ